MLTGLKVVELATVLAGPHVGMFFAELGAEVIKIENPLQPDVTRSWKLPTEKQNTTISAYFSSVNYKKTYVELNLKKPEDNIEVKQLIAEADILLTNFKKGDDQKFGLADSYLHAINPKLIIGKISGFGNDSDRVAYDLILQAETGFMSMNGTAESGPVKMPVALIDILAAHHLKEGILLALLERTKTGKGKIVSVSLYDAAISSLVNQASNYLMAKHIPQRLGSSHPNIAPYGELFTTSDGKIITFAIGSQIHFEKLVRELDLDSILSDKRFLNNQNRVANRMELANILQEKIEKRTSKDLLHSFHKLFIPVAEVKNVKDVFKDAAANKLVREEKIGEKTTKRVTSIAFKYEN